MKKQRMALKILAVIMAVLVTCFVATGKKIAAIIDSDIDDFFRLEEDDDENWKNKKNTKKEV